MKVFDRYIFKNLSIATIFVSVILATVILLTQSLRFLELVIEAGASSNAFWMLTFLALPRFFEIILPLSLMAAVIFIYNKMTSDSELVVIRSVGYSPLSLSQPAISLALIVCILLWAITMWAAPKALSTMQIKRQEIKAQFSSLLFREGVFNQAGKGLTVYARERGSDGTLYGLMINDARNKQQNPSTILAKRGILSSTDEGFQVLVFDGSRQEYNPETKTLGRLNFDRYTIDLPDSNPVRQRWQEPDERTIFELLSPAADDERATAQKREFQVEIHRRLVSPLLALAFTIISCVAMLIGPIDRRGQARRIIIAVLSAVLIQGLYIAAFNLARQSNVGLAMMYLLAIIPLGIGLFLLSGFGDKWRRHWLYKTQTNGGPA